MQQSPGVQPGEVIIINATMPGVPGTISTGVMILYADDEAFTVMTPEGHPESGFNTFSAYEEDGVVSPKFNRWPVPMIPFTSLASALWAGRKSRRKSGTMS